MSDDDDREWVDELAAARRAPGRTGEAANPFSAGGLERMVTCIDCHLPTPLSAFGWEVAKQCSEILLQRGQQPLRNDEMTRCAPCSETYKATANARYQRFYEQVNQAQRDANQSGVVNPGFVANLRKVGFGDYADAIESGAAKYGEKSAGKGRGNKERK